MSYTALYRKFRPGEFDEVKGQEHIVTTLKNEIRTDRIGHAYLFCGTRGTGKTTVAKILAKAVNCEHPVDGSPCGECEMCKKISSQTSMNVIEMDAASNNSVDDIREIIDEVQYSPAEGRYKVYIIDEVHMLSAAAFNALLKTLEEPPSYVIFILATTEAHKIPITILSRCQRYDFKRISIDTISARLKDLMERENVDVEDKALRYIAKVADGSMRDALSLLDQCIAFYLGEKLTYDKAIEVLGAVDTSVYSRMFRNMADLDVIGCMKLLDEIMMSGRDLNQFITGLIWYLRNLMVISVSASGSEMVDVSTEQLEQMQQEIKKVDETGLIRYIRILSELSNQIKYATQKRVLTEVAFVKLCVPEMEKKTSDDSLLARIDAIERKLESGIFVNGQPDNGGQNVSSVTNEAKTSKEPQPEVVLPKMVSDDLKKINGKWQQILSDISVSSRSFLMPEICKKTVSQDGETLILQFTDATAEAYFNRDDKRNLDELKTVISNIVGVDAGIIAETVSNEQSRNSLDLSQIIDKINFDVQIKK